MTTPSLSTRLARATAEAQHEVERIEAELDFAERLCRLHGAAAPAWRTLIASARARMEAALEARRSDRIPDAVRDAERALAPLAAIAKTYTVHCVGHAHIDMNWMWSWPETVSITHDTFATVLRFMDEFPTFTFAQSQASTYAIIEAHHPAMLDRIRQLVGEGRWEVTASHWVEGDKNLAGGESLCRHLLYTRRYMQRLFGLAPEDVAIDWSPDTFGHPATVPSYLARGGVRHLYLHRPGVHTPAKPEAFWWEGPDGSRVLVRNDMALGYNGVIAPAIIPHLERFVTLTGGRDFLFVYGVGDHGGGPTRRDIRRALDMDAWPVFPRFRFSTARAFYDALETAGARLPVVRGELNTEFTGCYTTQSLIKKANRFAESRLIDAEAAAAVAHAAAGHAYPAEALAEAWRDTLFSHFHDILPGSGVHDTRTYAHGLYQKTVAATSMIELLALRRLASQVDTSAASEAPPAEPPPSRLADRAGAGVGYRANDGELVRSDQTIGQGPRPFVVFNPTAFDRHDVIDVTVWDNGPGGGVPLKDRSFRVVAPDGRIIPAQVVETGGYWGHAFATLAFPAAVPGLGYALHIVEEDAAPAGREKGLSAARLTGSRHHCSYAPPERASEGMENDEVRVALDPRTGGIRSLLDKRSGIDLIDPSSGGASLEYAVERAIPMSAWSINNAGPVQAPEVRAVRRTLEGPHRAAIAVDLRVRESDLTVTYELRAGDPKLHVTVRGTWFQRGAPESGIPSLAFAIPLALDGATARYEIPFGSIERDLSGGEEVPALQWAMAAGTTRAAGQRRGRAAGCLLLNDSKHGHSLHGHVLRLTLIRSAYEPDILPEIGRHDIRMAIRPFAGVLPVSEAMCEGQAFNRALRPVGTDAHAGPLPPEFAIVRVSPGPVIVSGVKRAEESDALIVRLVNPDPVPRTSRIELASHAAGRVRDAGEVDLIERPVSGRAVRRSGRSVTARVPAFGITAVRIDLKP